VTAATDLARGAALGTLLVAIAWIVAQCGDVGDVHADDADPQLVLARMAAGEAGLDALPGEIAAMGEVMRRRGGGEIRVDVMRRYSSALRTGRQPWVVELSVHGTVPPSWPAHLAWERYERRWERIYAYAGRVVRGEARSRCVDPPDHFGARHGVDYARAVRAGWRAVDCGRTANAFWSVRR